MDLSAQNYKMTHRKQRKILITVRYFLFFTKLMTFLYHLLELRVELLGRVEVFVEDEKESRPQKTVLEISLHGSL